MLLFVCNKNLVGGFSMTDKGFTDKVKGKVKEATGEITKDKELETEGLIDQGKGKLKKAAGDVKDAAEEIKEKFHKKTDESTDEQ